MNVQCGTCGRWYDDAQCWTICPHGPLGESLESYCPRCDTTLHRHGPCVHQRQHTGPYPTAKEQEVNQDFVQVVPENVALKGLDVLQKEIGEWSRNNFGDNISKVTGHPTYSQNALTGINEEVGELNHVTICHHQGRRGYDNEEKYKADRDDALADILVFACDYAEREGTCLLTVLNRTWTNIVSKRDMKKPGSWEENTHEKSAPVEEPVKGRYYSEEGSKWNVETIPLIGRFAAKIQSEIPLQDIVFALEHGWTVERTNVDNDPVILPQLNLPLVGHLVLLTDQVSLGWCAVWIPYYINGEVVAVPSYLSKRIKEIEDDKKRWIDALTPQTLSPMQEHKEWLVNRAAEREREQNGQGWAELPERVVGEIASWEKLKSTVCAKCGDSARLIPGNSGVNLACGTCETIGFFDDKSNFITQGEWDRRLEAKNRATSVPSQLTPIAEDLGHRFMMAGEDKYGLARYVANTWLDGQVKHQALRMINNMEKADKEQQAGEAVCNDYEGGE